MQLKNKMNFSLSDWHEFRMYGIKNQKGGGNRKWKKVFAMLLALMMLPSSMSAIAEGSAIPRLEDIDTSMVNIDPANPLGPQFTGRYSFDVALEDGTVRQLYHCAPETVTYRQPAVAIGVPIGEDGTNYYMGVAIQIN